MLPVVSCQYESLAPRPEGRGFHPGAKAHNFTSLFGTAEAVPLQNSRSIDSERPRDVETYAVHHLQSKSTSLVLFDVGQWDAAGLEARDQLALRDCTNNDDPLRKAY